MAGRFAAPVHKTRHQTRFSYVSRCLYLLSIPIRPPNGTSFFHVCIHRRATVFVDGGSDTAAQTALSAGTKCQQAIPTTHIFHINSFFKINPEYHLLVFLLGHLGRQPFDALPSRRIKRAAFLRKMSTIFCRRDLRAELGIRPMHTAATVLSI